MSDYSDPDIFFKGKKTILLQNENNKYQKKICLKTIFNLLNVY